eukprot:c9973_g1_i1 orf=356-631(-)
MERTLQRKPAVVGCSHQESNPCIAHQEFIGIDNWCTWGMALGMAILASQATRGSGEPVAEKRPFFCVMDVEEGIRLQKEEGICLQKKGILN